MDRGRTGAAGMSEASGFYERLLESHPQPHCVLGSDGRLVFANRAFQVLFGNAHPCLDDTGTSARLTEALQSEAATPSSIVLSAGDGRLLDVACTLYRIDHPAHEPRVVVVFERG